MEKQESERAAAARSTVIVPTTNYKDKYEHLIGKEAAKDAAKLTTANKSYGFGKYLWSSLQFHTNDTATKLSASKRALIIVEVAKIWLTVGCPLGGVGGGALSTMTTTYTGCSRSHKDDQVVVLFGNVSQPSCPHREDLIAVSSENKRDKRTIEEVMADSRAKKKMKGLEGDAESESTGAQSWQRHR